MAALHSQLFHCCRVDVTPRQVGEARHVSSRKVLLWQSACPRSGMVCGLDLRVCGYCTSSQQDARVYTSPAASSGGYCKYIHVLCCIRRGKGCASKETSHSAQARDTHLA